MQCVNPDSGSLFRLTAFDDNRAGPDAIATISKFAGENSNVRAEPSRRLAIPIERAASRPRDRSRLDRI